MKKKLLQKISLCLITSLSLSAWGIDQKSIVIAVSSGEIDFTIPSLKAKMGLASGLNTAQKYAGWNFLTNSAIDPEKIVSTPGEISNNGHGDIVARGQRAKIISLRMIQGTDPSSFNKATALSDELSSEKMPEAQRFSQEFIKEQKRIFSDVTKYLKTNQIVLTTHSWTFSSSQFPDQLGALYFEKHKVKLSPNMNRIWALDTLSELKPIVREFIQSNRKTLFIFNAGEEVIDNDDAEIYPQSFQLDNLIVVGATDGYSKPAQFGAFGSKTVHIMAPGTQIEIPTTSNKSISGNGTYLSSAVVANAIAGALETNSQLTPKELKALTIQTADERGFLKGKCLANGTIHSERLVEAAKLMKEPGVTVKRASEKAHERISKPKDGFWEKSKAQSSG